MLEVLITSLLLQQEQQQVLELPFLLQQVLEQQVPVPLFCHRQQE
jgi:hypothetical protein